MEELMDYSLYDVNGDAYTIRIKRREAVIYDQDHMRCYRQLNMLKRAGIRPKAPNNSDDSLFTPNHNSTMNLMVEHCPIPADDLRSPCSKKGRPADAKDLDSSFEALCCDEVEEGLAEPLPAEFLITSWNEDGVHIFINEMGARIEKFKGKIKNKNVYDEIAKAMLDQGYKFERDALYSKKRGLDTYYCNQKKKGGKSKWPFFEGMKHLHSGVWPEGFRSATNQLVSAGERKDLSLMSSSESHQREQPQNQEDWHVEQQESLHEDQGLQISLLPGEDELETEEQAGAAPYKAATFKWNDAQDAALVEEVFEAQQKFEGRDLLKNIELFKEVSKQMTKRGVNQDHGQCKKRYEHLKAIFNQHVDQQSGTGAGACTWHLYEAMFDIEKDSVTTKAPVTVSLGAVPKLKRANETAQQPRLGRERPPTATRQQRIQRLTGNTSATSSSSEGPMGYKNRALYIQQKRLEMEMQYVEEFRQYRLEARDRGNAIRESIEVLKDLKAQRDKLETIPE